MTEHCVCCGDEIPEGSHICPRCRWKAESMKPQKPPKKSKNTGKPLVLIGMLCLLAALLLVCGNLMLDWMGHKSTAVNARRLEIQLRQTPTSETTAAPAAHRREALPAYMLDPDTPMPVAESGGNLYIGLLEIDALSLELPILDQWSCDGIKTAPARYSGSVYQNNVVIAGHNYLSHFGRLKELAVGDTVAFTDMDGNRFIYHVTQTDILEPSQIEEMTCGDWDMTLFTCTVGGTSRVTVRCTRLYAGGETGSAAPSVP